MHRRRVALVGPQAPGRSPSSIFAGLVLSTMFAFFYVHSGRTANTDAINTLLILLTVVTLWEAREARWRLLWLGPIFAAVFLLRGHGRHHAARRSPSSCLVMEPAVAAGPPRPARSAPLPARLLPDRRLGRQRDGSIDGWAVPRAPLLVRLRRALDDEHRGPSGRCLLLPRRPAAAPLRLAGRRVAGVAALPGSRATGSSDLDRCAAHRGRSRAAARVVGDRRIRHSHPDDHQARVVLHPFYPVFAIAVMVGAPGPCPGPTSPRRPAVSRRRRVALVGRRRPCGWVSPRAAWSGTATTTASLAIVTPQGLLLAERDRAQGTAGVRATAGTAPTSSSPRRMAGGQRAGSRRTLPIFCATASPAITSSPTRSWRSSRSPLVGPFNPELSVPPSSRAPVGHAAAVRNGDTMPCIHQLRRRTRSMKRNYHCPKCYGILNPNVKVILKTECGGRTALLLFSPQPGNYHVIAPESFPLKKDDEVRFSVPALLAGPHVEARQVDGGDHLLHARRPGRARRVSRALYGHHETCFVTKEEVRSFGRHADRDGVNYWGAGPKGLDHEVARVAAGHQFLPRGPDIVGHRLGHLEAAFGVDAGCAARPPPGY
ncbi:MAG: hypothetical protein MZV49_25120 [Rhodopseudomonas palustris]|nr:hypothetical protein [Rhodopseudomonas palustris]